MLNAQYNAHCSDAYLFILLNARLGPSPLDSVSEMMSGPDIVRAMIIKKNKTFWEF